MNKTVVYWCCYEGDIMKRIYEKPALLFEDFRLMDAIAASCLVPGQHNDKDRCGFYMDTGDVIFTNENNACEVGWTGEVGMDDVFPS